MMMPLPDDSYVPEADICLNDRPNHPQVIQNDEIINLKIDLAMMPSEEIFAKYFA